jgi:sodium-dependent phosphate transporter
MPIPAFGALVACASQANLQPTCLLTPVCFLFSLFLQTKGVKGIVTITPQDGAWYAAAGAAGATLIGTAIIWPIMKRSLANFHSHNTNSLEAGKDAGSSVFQEEDRFQKAVTDKLKPVHVDVDDKSIGAMFKRFRNAALSGVTHDIHADVKDDEGIMEMHEAAEKFDPRTEHVFKVLQVISACAMSFSHGEWALPCQCIA